MLNSGVMVLDLEHLRSSREFDRVLEYLFRFRDYGQHDNDGLNAVFAESWRPLSILWNVQLDALRRPWIMPPSPLTDRLCADSALLRRDAHILHYTASPKPWQMRLPRREHGRWFHYLRKSGWFSPIGYHIFHLKCLLRGQGHGARAIAKRVQSVLHGP